MQAINYLLKFFFDAAVLILLLRVWMQLVRADFYNPLSQFVVKITQPVVTPFRRIIPGFGGLDVATLVLAYLIITIKFIVIPMLNGADFQPLAALYYGALSLVKQAGVLLFMVMLIMAILSWVSQGYNPTQAVFIQLTEPVLKPIRKVIPTIAGLDLSVLFAFLILNFINILLAGIIPGWLYL